MYIDNVMLVWDNGEAEYVKFVEYLYSVHPTIKFTDEHSLEISFCDTFIIKDDQGGLAQTCS